MANTIETNKVTHIEPCTPNMSVERCFLEIKPPNMKEFKPCSNWIEIQQQIIIRKYSKILS
jgi:hypothetical protein